MKNKSLNLLELYPLHNVRWKQNDDGLVVLLSPRIKNPLLVKLIGRFIKRPDYQIKLDEFGSFVWHHIDGLTNVQHIGDALSNKYGEKIDPVFQRLSLFINSLAHNKFIILREKNNNHI